VVGALVTLDLPADSPAHDLPWIITVGPMHDDQEWEPVVCGPYERAHALALAEAVVADEDLMAVVEPLLPLVDATAIRDEIELAQNAADTDPVDEDAADSELTAGEGLAGHARPSRPPSADEVRAGFARIAGKLTDAG
jgi:hypothetical protein